MTYFQWRLLAAFVLGILISIDVYVITVILR